MPQFLRKITRNRWIDYPKLPDNTHNDVELVPLVNFAERATVNKLSVWELESDQSNLDRVAVAMCTGRTHLDNFDYVLFDSEFLTQAEIEFEKTDGDSVDQEAAKQWHWDLSLSGYKLVRLTRLILNDIEADSTKLGQLKKND